MNGQGEQLLESVAATSCAAALAQDAKHFGSAASLDELDVSWERCMRQHRLDPDGGNGPRILSSAEVKRLRAPLEQTLAAAQEEINALHAMVRPLGYATLLADPGGVIIERYCRAEDAGRFADYGTQPGAVWTEQAEGTNGIGTCIVEQRPLSVHRQQHFNQRYAGLSCSGAPIFDAAGKLKAVLTLASHAGEISERSHQLALALATYWSRAIEERDFRESHRRHWTFALEPAAGNAPAVLLAVDADHRIVAADRHARRALALPASRIDAGIHLRDVFDRYPVSLRGKGAEDLAVSLRRNESGAQWQGVATPPEAGGGAYRSATRSALHTRPRLAQLSASRPASAQTLPRGGLPPGILRSLDQYIRNNLERNLPVEALAAVAGLSPTHFARAFKNSVGVTPHHYLTQQRVEKAAQLLAESDRSMAEIAQAVGFSDQSHLSRRFTRLVGTTPGAYRHARR
ncbi:helix-turn-helix domain-containing protein [Nevskia soli]|uniref:helix-turn-helix domain-containing protein n=1 Tax=Nevskia soli TaxID=418856 RepID=UPI000A0166BB|nr:helix-turn-helix domain-containing protein [Nevskia soli]